MSYTSTIIVISFLTYLQISEEQPSTSQVPATQEHGYSLKRKAETIESENKKRPRKQNTQKISKNIESMTQESLDILKNIEKNTERIATSFEEFVNLFQARVESAQL